MTLFATHYFELTQLPEKMEGVANVHLDALEHGDTIAFMHSGAGRRGQQELWPGGRRAGGGAERGDQARAAETARAGEYLAQRGGDPGRRHADVATRPPAEETSPAVEALENLDPDSLTPRQALEWIYRLKRLV